MEQTIIHHTLKTVAQNHHISQDQLNRELEDLIAETLSELSESNNTQALAAWQQIPKEGDIPTAEELIYYLARKVSGNL